MKRLHGLDTLRAAAIVLVLAYHYQVVVTGTDTFGWLTTLGWTGVDLFFVLSGYLIGNQIIASPRDFSVPRFYVRRLLRTLPNYYVILALYMLVPALMEKETAPLWRFLTFTQNFGLRPGQTFTHSWSLCIEEQFYLILPALVLLTLRFRRAKALGWLLLALGLATALVLRARAWHGYGEDAINPYDYYQQIYYSSLCRFDELLPGVAIAMLKNLHPVAYARITGKGNALLAAGLAGVAAMFYAYFGGEYSYFNSIFGYTLLALSFSALVLAALSENSLLHKLRVPGAYQLALLSYAIYLAHKPIYKLAATQLRVAGIEGGSMTAIAIILTLSLLGGWLLFRLVESPFMALRARLYQQEVGSVLTFGHKLIRRAFRFL